MATPWATRLPVPQLPHPRGVRAHHGHRQALGTPSNPFILHMQLYGHACSIRRVLHLPAQRVTYSATATAKPWLLSMGYIGIFRAIRRDPGCVRMRR